MAIRVVNGSAADWNDLEHHWPAVIANFEKLAKRFPTDITVDRLKADIGIGQDVARRVLWLVLDDDNLLATALTAIETIDCTGVRIARLMDLAGSDVGAWAGPLNKALEAWGDENGVDYYAVEGRSGWGRVIEPLGYRKHAVLWRKRAA